MFRLKVALQGERAITSFSLPQTRLLDGLSTKTVAIVGNARSLESGRNGADIDGHDIVLRMHKAPMPSSVSHGKRTDWLALGMPVPESLLNQLSPDRLLWMTHARKRLRLRLAERAGFYRHPVADWQALADKLGSPPSTGALVVDLVSRSGAVQIDLYGFDFFASLSASGSRTAAQVPHDFAAEQGFVEGLIAADPRVALHRPSD
ncbi:MAG: glycosyltransferase family 29 protein [Pseudomonadota bacterium]